MTSLDLPLGLWSCDLALKRPFSFPKQLCPPFLVGTRELVPSNKETMATVQNSMQDSPFSEDRIKSPPAQSSAALYVAVHC